MSRPIRCFARAVALPACCLCLGFPTAATAPAATKTNIILLRVEPVEVKKGHDTQLTATVEPSGTCTRRAVLFQVEGKHGWEDLGKNVRVGRSCSVSRKVEVKAKRVFRVLLIDPKKPATLVKSPSVTVKLA